MALYDELTASLGSQLKPVVALYDELAVNFGFPIIEFVSKKTSDIANFKVFSRLHLC